MQSIYNKDSISVIDLDIIANMSEHGIVGACLISVANESGVCYAAIFGMRNTNQVKEARTMFVGKMHENGVSTYVICELLGRSRVAVNRYIRRHKELVEIYGMI